MQNKKVSVIFKILPVAAIIAGGFLFNVNAEDYTDAGIVVGATPIDGSTNISSSASSVFASYNALSCGDNCLYNQLEGFTVTNDKLVLYNIQDAFQTSIGNGVVSGYTGTNFGTAVSGSPFTRNYDHGNDMTYDTKMNKILVVGIDNRSDGSTSSKDVPVLNSGTLGHESTIQLSRGAFAIGYDEVDDEYVIFGSKDSIRQFWFVNKDAGYTLHENTAITAQSGQHGGENNVEQGIEYYKGFIYSTVDNWDFDLDGEVAYIHVYNAKLKSDGTKDEGYGTKVATYYINAKDLGEVESISFRNGKAYLGFANGSTRNNVTKFTRFNASLIEQAFPAPSVTYQDGTNSTSVIITSHDAQLTEKDGWTRSSDGYSLTKTVRSASVSGNNVEFCDRYGNCAKVSYSHTNSDYRTSFALTYNYNGGDGDIEAQSCSTSGSSCQIIVSSTIPTKTGYSFFGWAENASATTATISGGDQITLTGDKIIYAVWSKNTPTPDPDPDDPVTPDDPGKSDTPSDKGVLAPDTSMVNGSDDGSYGGYLIGASVIVAVSVIVGNIVRKVKTNHRIQFK